LSTTSNDKPEQDAVLEEVRARQSRPLDAVYPILYLDALQVKVKSQGSVRNKAIYLAFGVSNEWTQRSLGHLGFG
jgi:putative transposase